MKRGILDLGLFIAAVGGVLAAAIWNPLKINDPYYAAFAYQMIGAIVLLVGFLVIFLIEELRRERTRLKMLKAGLARASNFEEISKRRALLNIRRLVFLIAIVVSILSCGFVGGRVTKGRMPSDKGSVSRAVEMSICQAMDYQPIVFAGGVFIELPGFCIDGDDNE